MDLQLQPQDAAAVMAQHQQVQAAKRVPQQVAGAVVIHLTVCLHAGIIVKIIRFLLSPLFLSRLPGKNRPDFLSL